MSAASIARLLLTLVLKTGAIALLLSLARGALWLVNMLVFQPPFDPLRKLPGPDAAALQNHFREVMDPNLTPDTHHEWMGRYGKTFRFHGFGKHDYRLMSFDFRVVSYILNSPLYEKPWQTRTLLSRLLGRGIFAMEGYEHKFQRRLIGPAFTTQSVKALTPIFFQKAEELRDRWDSFVNANDNGDSDGTIIDVSHWISRATFDVIGLAGFDYHFHSLQDESEEVYLAYRKMFNVADKGPGLKGLLQIYFPVIETLFPDEGIRTTRNSLQTIRQAGQALIASKKMAILADKASADDISEKDILSLLIKQNLSEDPSKRLSDAEILDQLSTFLFAGSDSTSLAISWCLHLLAHHPDTQSCLRSEIMSVNVPTVPTHALPELSKIPDVPDSGFAETFSPVISPPTTYYSAPAHSDVLDSLPFLDAVVRETLRLCPPVHGTIRVATADDLIPITHPVLMRDGTLLRKGDYISIRKGSYVHIPIEGLNYSEDIWGKDARTFNPDRWSSLPPTARAPVHPGLANLMTFSFGPHSCPGWKFSIMEMKVFIATILPQFVFRPAEGLEVKKFNAILTRPYVIDKWEEGTKLPLHVSKYAP